MPTWEDLTSRWTAFWQEPTRQIALSEIAEKYPALRTFPIRFEELRQFDPNLAESLLVRPGSVLEAGVKALRDLMPGGTNWKQLSPRVSSLPAEFRIPVPDLRASHHGRFISVRVVVVGAGEIKPMMVEATFQCSRCGTVVVEPQDTDGLRKPLECYEDQGGCKRSARDAKLRLLEHACLYIDVQQVTLREDGGPARPFLRAVLKDDLAGIASGARAVMNGTLSSRSRTRGSSLRDYLLLVNSIEPVTVA